MPKLQNHMNNIELSMEIFNFIQENSIRHYHRVVMKGKIECKLTIYWALCLSSDVEDSPISMQIRNVVQFVMLNTKLALSMLGRSYLVVNGIIDIVWMSSSIQNFILILESLKYFDRKIMELVSHQKLNSAVNFHRNWWTFNESNVSLTIIHMILTSLYAKKIVHT